MSSPSTCLSLQDNISALLERLAELGWSAEEAGEEEADPACEGINSAEYGRGLHIAAIFIVLVASALGTALPILGRYIPSFKNFQYIFVLGKCAATGVVLSVSLIHMIGEAAEMFEADCVPEKFKESYESYAFLFSMIAALLMHGLDLLLSLLITAHMEKRALAKKQSDDSASEDAVKKIEPTGNEMVELSLATKPYGDDAAVALTDSHEHDCDSGHGHSHLGNVHREVSPLQRVVAAVLMEFGVTVHSLFVGLALGLAENSEMKALLIAIVFHQFFEGVALGSRLAEAEFRISFEAGMALLFSIAAPVGVAAGVGTAIAGDGISGATYVMLEAILTSICGGILLYLAFTLMVVDFVEDMQKMCPPGCRFRTLRRLGLVFAMWAGAAVLAVLGKWA